MSKEFQQSLVRRTGLALAVLILMAVINMLASYLTAESSENDAARINLAGSLRMQTYRLANEYILEQTGSSLADRAHLNQAVADFEYRLRRPILAEHIRNTGKPALKEALAGVEETWLRLKPAVLTLDIAPAQVLAEFDDFVTIIDQLVKKLELETEQKFRLLRLIQGTSLLITLCLASIMFLSVYKYVVGPLRQLVSMAEALRAGDFSMRLNSKNNDELGLLANTFNAMAISLDDMYRTLEEQVQSKTLHLEKTQKMLRFLYHTSNQLGAEGSVTKKLEQTLEHLCREIDVLSAELHIHHTEAGEPFLIACAPQQASNAGPAGESSSPPARRYPLKHLSCKYGFLEIVPANEGSIGNEQDLMLTALTDTIVVALINETRQDDGRRMALMEERTAIARELHDSIAQSLSFTKIQISRLQNLLGRDHQKAELEEILLELRTSVQEAYAQLRELLTTFRLQLDAPGLQASLSRTAEEFTGKGNITVKLESSLQNYPLTPNEEIHILQIVREALSNVVRHSGADLATVRLRLDPLTDRIDVRITDNGRGMTLPGHGDHSYGKTIMSERAAILDGELEYGLADGGGTEVVLRFTAEHATSRRAETRNSAIVIQPRATAK